MKTFYLGTHKPHWLRLVDVPLFISRVTLSPYRALPRAVGRWVLDSGGFTELSKHGGWSVDAHTYVAEVRRFRDEVGGLDWAAPQDWMCEPSMLARTGLTVAEHQRRTLDNFLELRALAPDLPIAPVLQGWQPRDYIDHVEAYARAGVELADEPVVGLGTVCRRQASMSAVRVVDAVLGAAPGVKLHGFGFKTKGLAMLARYMHSADSLAWSLNARKRPPIDGHTHKNCANCLDYALAWRARLLIDVT